MNSPGSDFDCKVVVKYPRTDYMLGKVKETRNFKTEVNGVEVEGQTIDILTQIKYAVTTNATAYDTWSSIPVLETETSKALKQYYLEAYQPHSIQSHAFGMLAGYKRQLVQEEHKGSK